MLYKQEGKRASRHVVGNLNISIPLRNFTLESACLKLPIFPVDFFPLPFDTNTEEF